MPPSKSMSVPTTSKVRYLKLPKLLANVLPLIWGHRRLRQNPMLSLAENSGDFRRPPPVPSNSSAIFLSEVPEWDGAAAENFESAEDAES
jgi:hypothetical protein